MGKVKFEIAPEYTDISNFLLQIPSTLDDEGTILQRKRNTVKRVMSPNNVPLIVKRYKIPNLVQRLSYTFFRPSKAKRAYLYAQRLLSMNIATPTPIAYIEEYKNGLFRESFFICTECEDETLFDVLIKVEHFDKGLADAFAIYVVTLHKHGFLHGDLNLDNVFYHRTAQGVQFSTIDINRSHFKVEPTQTECLDNLIRVTHRRDLLAYIVETYAARMTWDPDFCTNYVMRKLDEFERRRKIKRAIKNVLLFRWIKSFRSPH
jgi:tRNA A-37 threonylcarbamoyl transferase component Bud32